MLKAVGKRANAALAATSFVAELGSLGIPGQPNVASDAPDRTAAIATGKPAGSAWAGSGVSSVICASARIQGGAAIRGDMFSESNNASGRRGPSTYAEARAISV